MVDSTNLPEVDINQIATDLNGKMDRDTLNASAITGILGMLQKTDPSKVGYIYNVSGVASSVYSPQGGKWLILCLYQHNQSSAALYGYLGDIHYSPGDIVDGGELVLALRSGYINTVSMIKIA